MHYKIQKIILALVFISIGAAPAFAETPEFPVYLKGYSLSCMNKPIISKKENGEWKQAFQNLPGKGMYFLDDKYIGYGMCDMVVCNEIPKPYKISLVEYRKVNDKPTPVEWRQNTTSKTMPAYQTISLKGAIKIDIEYFSDKECKNKKLFSTVVHQ